MPIETLISVILNPVLWKLLSNITLNLSILFEKIASILSK